MKKLFILSLVALSFIACSKEDTSITETTANLTVNAFQPQKQFDTKSQGVYVGSVVSVDLQYHSKILINAGNNGNYTAKTTINDIEYNFNAEVEKLTGLNAINFVDNTNNSAFKLNILDFQNPQVTEFTINGVDAHMVLQKSSSTNRADVLIGNFTDVDDTSFTGTFDVFTNGVPHPYNELASIVTRTSFVAPGGALFVDENMETFDFTVCTEDAAETDFIPLMFVNTAGTSAHFYADNQTSTVVDLELTWQVFHFLNDGYYIQFLDVPGFDDGCYETASGLWGWNGRYGVISFDFFDDSEGFTPSTNDEALDLTSEIIQAILEN